MVHYKLTYFDVRGLGEVSRQLFYLADVEFEDVQISRTNKEEFEKLKPFLPSGQLPILEIDNFTISQSSAIGRYLARKFGFAGKTPEEEAKADEIIDLFKDFLVNQKQFNMAIRQKKSPEELEKIIETVVNPAKKIYFSALNKFLEKSSSGFLVGNSLTWADLQVADNLTTLKGFGIFTPSEEPLLNTFHQKIQNMPKLKEYLEKRPISEL